MSNFLSTVITTFTSIDNPYTFNFIGKVVKWIIELVPNMGLGIIIFTVVLKLVTLLPDYWSRASMKKNNLKMEKMRPQLEKLQRQYQNQPQIYNEKIRALYKKENYSAVSSCLPTIITLVIFIIVINQFSNYSSYKNLSIIEGMVDSYNTAITTYNDTHMDKPLVKKVGSEYYLDEITAFGSIADQTGVTVTQGAEENQYEYQITDFNKFAAYVKSLNDAGFTKVKVGEAQAILPPAEGSSDYTINLTGDHFEEGTTEAEAKRKIVKWVFEYKATSIVETEILSLAREAAAVSYRENVPSFLWVKNIWAEDLPWKHPVKATFSEYNFTERKGCKSEKINVNISDELYAELTYNLQDEKNAPNGYMILVVLSIGVMVLSQIVMNKTQKAQLDLQSVNGQAQQTSKMMTWMMPIMFGIFAFIYTASFSLYMVVSSLLSTGTTLLINKIVEKRFNKKAEEEALANDKRFRKK
ncbi:MAG: YidC/Oxa1 family membrane protein insertase [Clostridia bacterium]|nr:YidC/Oxa1 family membrane protein insertase [Clostridia bacterium]MBR6687397.1 YidC/Oxa1 family membrane protein insertase [Clostridia bacterium]